LLYTPNLPKAASEHNSKTQIAVGASRSCGAVARARTLGVNMLSENAFKEMPTLADKSSDFRFSSGIQVYFWTQRQKQTTNLNAPMIVSHWGQSRNIVGSSRGRHRVPTEVRGGYLARWVVGSSRGGFHFRRSRIQRRRRKSAIAATTARRARR
jgi:hypothetical protein